LNVTRAHFDADYQPKKIQLILSFRVGQLMTPYDDRHEQMNLLF